MGETSTRSKARQRRVEIKSASKKEWDLVFHVVEFDDRRILFTVTDVSAVFNKVSELKWTIAIVDGAENSNRQKLQARAKELTQDWSDYSKNATPSPRRLAEEGYDLFSLVFKSDTQDATAETVAEAIRQVATQWLAERDPDPREWQPMLYIRITGANIHLPWNMMFPFPKATEANCDAFFGYFLSIEDDTQPAKMSQRPRGSWGETVPTRLSLQLDELKIRTAVHTEVRNVLIRYPRTQLVQQSRDHSEDFLSAWEHTSFDDEIIYFCCHGKAGSPDRFE